MTSLAFSASPIDFQKNEQLEHKISQKKNSKLSTEFLKRMTNNREEGQPMQPSSNDVENIHNNLHENIKHDNETVLGNFYANELKEDIKEQMNKVESTQDLYHNKNVLTDYLISNNLDINKITGTSNKKIMGNETRDELLEKLNHIILLFEDEREIKTNKKNEEIILYCFLGIFVIYVLDSFVSMGKYKR